EDAIAVARAQTLVRALTGEMEKLRAEQMAGQREFDRLRDHVEPFSDAVANAGGNIEAATPKVERLSQTVDKGALAADRMRDALTAERAALAGVDPALVAFDKRVETMARSLAAYPALLKQWRTEMAALRQQLVATEIQEVNDALDRALRERLAKLGAEHGRDLQSSMSGSLRAGISVASKSVDDSLRASEAARERAERPLLQAAENVQRAFGDLWTRVFDGGIRSFADIADFARQTFARLAGEVAAMWAQKSLAGPMLSMLGVGGAGGSSVDGPLGRINIPSVSSLQGMTWGKGIGSAGAGLGLGYALGGMTQSSIGGFALGAASGAGAGFAVGGPMGAVIGGLAGAVGGLLGAGTAQQEAARAMREAAETWKVASKALYGYGNGAYGERQGREDDIRSRFANAEAGFLAQFHPDVQKNIRAHGGVTAFAEMVRGNPSGWAGGEQAVEFADALKAALQRAQQEFFEDWGLSMAGLSARQMAASGNARGADDLRFAMAQDEERFAAERRFGVDTEEGRAYLEQLKKAQELEKAERERMRAEREADLRADYDVRALRAESRSEEAEALQLRLAQEREYREAERAGLDAATLARLKEVQAMEATSKAAERAAEARRALEDLDVRALTAGGRDREADELRFRLNQERELEDAIRGGRGADYLTRLREVQELERQARARAAAAPEAAGLSDAGETRASVYARGTITGASAQAVDTLISLGQAQTGWLMLIERNTRGGGATETVGNVAGTSVTDGRAFDRYQGQRYRQLRAGVGARRIVFMS
ncbi:MAG TPA: hypothetical protein VEA99_08285, partial [Gemmatimonadaceae bacterium]|nr:hypothetical protein [Gemmatimonadaceae bacterium]